MDFIERIFGVSPDGGDGTTELIYLFSFLVCLGLAGALMWSKRQAPGRSSR